MRVDSADFLSRHWQKEHCFIPGGLEGLELPLDADDLAGLAMERGVDARLLRCASGNWTQETGPFDLETLQAGGAWSLLVRPVDHYFPSAARLFDSLPLLPGWRFDDILMSYATDGGSAGPHFDLYDVFIVQGSGQRDWDIGQRCDEHSPLMAHPELKLLADFDTRASYTLHTGDVLYIPPGVAHRGVSRGESTSFSIGLRAPRLSDLLARWADNLLATVDTSALLRDPERSAAGRPGEISAADLALAGQQLAALIHFDDPRWFGEAVTDVTSDTRHRVSTDTRTAHAELELAPEARMAWYRHSDSQLLLFAAGDSLLIDHRLESAVVRLCERKTVIADPASETPPGFVEVLEWLVDNGTLVPHE